MASSRNPSLVTAPESSCVDQALSAWFAHAQPASGGLLIVGFSGGMDSTVLLEALRREATIQDGRWKIHAVHIHHGLQSVAKQWPAHCAQVAREFGVSFETIDVKVQACGKGIEAAARDARYAALAQRARALGAQGLLTAHHRDDQLETLLMRLARGTGLDGLEGIPICRPWPEAGVGCWIGRPLLELDRTAIQNVAQHRGLRWIDDPSNDDTHATRNALRAQVIPALDRALPNWRTGFARSQTLLDDARQRLLEQAERDLEQCQGPGPLRLDAAALLRFDAARRRAVWRLWLARLGLQAPSVARLAAMDRGLALARSGAVDHEGWRLRRWREVIFADPRGDAPADPTPLAETSLVWRGEREIWLPAWHGWLEFHAPDETARTDLPSAAGPAAGAPAGPASRPAAGPAAGLAAGLAVDWLRTATLTIRSDRAGASLRLGPRQRRRKLKGLYQSLAIAPWQRARLPLVFNEGQLIYAAGLGLDSDCSSRHPGPVQIGWRSADPSP